MMKKMLKFRMIGVRIIHICVTITVISNRVIVVVIDCYLERYVRMLVLSMTRQHSNIIIAIIDTRNVQRGFQFISLTLASSNLFSTSSFRVIYFSNSAEM